MISAVFLLLLGFPVFNSIQHPERWPGIVLIAIMWAAVISWQKGFRIVIEGDLLTFHSPLGPPWTISRKNLKELGVFEGRLNKSLSIFDHHIQITLNDLSSVRLLTKQFSEADIREVLAFLEGGQGEAK